MKKIMVCVILSILAVANITACGGGGSSSSSNNATPPPPASTPLPQPSGKVPDTGQIGQIGNATAIFGEDADYTINPPSYTDNGNGTITDNVTNLVWQKSNDIVLKTIDVANAYCTNLSLGGNSGWRLPSVSELVGIGNYNIASPSLNLTYFNLNFTDVNLIFWTSTPRSNDQFRRWAVNANGNIINTPVNGATHYARCVRGHISQHANTFANNGDGTITDNVTLLQWQKHNDEVQRTWEPSLTYCEDLALAGHTDWRLPSIKELESITDYSYSSPALNMTYFPVTTVSTNMTFWTSTHQAGSTTTILYIDYGTGFITHTALGGLHRSRCVRSLTGPLPPAGTNSAPVANAGIDQHISTGALVTLNGSDSGDANSDALTYSWSFTSKPVGSTAALSSATVVSPTFTADKDGYYVLNLTVNDGTVSSAADTVQIRALGPGANFKMPDTRQTTSYTATFGEDHDYIINPPSYTDNGNGTITDNVTTLVWQKDDASQREWNAAGFYCDTLALGGQTDWRLPSQIELISIIDNGSSYPAINTTYFKNTVTSGFGGNYWSSTTVVGPPGTNQAWGVDFGKGSSYYFYNGAATCFVRCVRGGQ